MAYYSIKTNHFNYKMTVMNDEFFSLFRFIFSCMMCYSHIHRLNLSRVVNANNLLMLMLITYQLT